VVERGAQVLILGFLGTVLAYWAGVAVWMLWWASYETVRAFFGVQESPEKKYKISRHQQTVRNILAMERELYGNNNNQK